MTRSRKDWLNKSFRELRKEFGNKCLLCDKRNILEFAHISPTKLNGSGRGKRKRYYDMKNNKNCYALLCKHCHVQADENEEIMEKIKKRRFQ